MNTKNILFICGGAFDGLEKIIEQRLDQKTMGFGADIQSKKEKNVSQLLAQVGDTVNKYDTIAKVGATGDVTGNHLHICVIIDGVYVNPKGYLH